MEKYYALPKACVIHNNITMMDYEIRIATYYNRFNTLFKLNEIIAEHVERNNTPLNRLALEMSRHHLERCLNNPDNRS